MLIARWLVAFVALYKFGGLVADAIVPKTALMHIRNPAWPPHAKFHNVQTMLMGVFLGTLTLTILFALPVSRANLLIAVATSGIYFWSMLLGEFFPANVTWVDPEFASEVKKVAGLPPQKFVALVLTALLVIAIVSASAL